MDIEVGGLLKMTKERWEGCFEKNIYIKKILPPLSICLDRTVAPMSVVAPDMFPSKSYLNP
jgi:hypothetical protein